MTDAALRAIVLDAATRAIRRRVVELFGDGPVSYERLVEVVSEEFARIEVRLQEEGYIRQVKIEFVVKL